jgi:hypothetical protein
VPTRPVAMRLVLQRLRELTRGYCAPEDPRKLERDERVYDELAQLRCVVICLVGSTFSHSHP